MQLPKDCPIRLVIRLLDVPRIAVYYPAHPVLDDEAMRKVVLLDLVGLWSTDGYRHLTAIRDRPLLCRKNKSSKSSSNVIAKSGLSHSAGVAALSFEVWKQIILGARVNTLAQSSVLHNAFCRPARLSISWPDAALDRIIAAEIIGGAPSLLT
jgi:hypothetical protein